MAEKESPMPSPVPRRQSLNEGHQPVIVQDGHQPLVDITKGHQPVVAPGRASTGHQALPSADPPTPPPATGSLAKPSKK